MSERAYTVKEIDDLRRACDERYLFGSCAPTTEGRSSMSCRESDKAIAVEEMVRTHMLAGHTAQDLIDEDINKETRWRSVLNSPRASTTTQTIPTRS